MITGFDQKNIENYFEFFLAPFLWPGMMLTAMMSMTNQFPIGMDQSKPKTEGGADMKDTRSFHKKMQEHIDCYAETEYLTEMAKVREEPDIEQAALNLLALSVLHGLDQNVEKIKIEKEKDGKVTMTAKYREAKLPSPPREIADKVMEIMREITHIESDKGEIPLSVGIRDSSIDLKIKIKRKDDKEKITLKFPDTK